MTTPMSRAGLNALSSTIISSAIAVHRELGPGLLESVYQHCLVYELRSRSVQVETNVAIPLFYKGLELKKDFILDLLVEKQIVLELKSVDGLLPVHEAQLLSYLKITNLRLGLLINFNTATLKQGLKRFVNNF